MLEQLLNAEARGLTAPVSRRRFGPLRGGDDFDSVAVCSGGVLAFLFVVFSFLLSSLDPNEYGLLRNYLSGTIGYDVVRGGLHLTGPIKGFIAFPATQVTLEFSNKPNADRAPVMTRTGADPVDPDSGGQSISISCAFQYQFVASELRDVYLSFGSYEAARLRYLLLAGNMVSNTAQEFTPQDFWTKRDVIAARMLKQINQTLWWQGSVMATRFEIMKVDFAAQFEVSITQVQVAEQRKVVNEYEQQVQQVVQSIAVLNAENNAHIANISAAADAKAKEIRARAKRDAFNLKQGMKAAKYAELKEKLGLDSRQLQEYFKIKSVQGQGQGSKVVVGMPTVGAAAPNPTTRQASPEHERSDL